MKLTSRNIIGMVLLLTIGGAGGALATRVVQDEHLGYQDTPMQANGKWHVHDGLRPQPNVIDPGTASTQRRPGRPPSDAIILFNGKNLSHWTDGGKTAAWKMEHGYMEVTPKMGSIATTDQIGDCQLHVEWTAPSPGKGSGQGRGNSGVLFFGKYEIQVLDSFESKTYPDGQAAALYGSYPPLVNATHKPGDWNVYDILFTVPHFDGEKLVKPGYFTVFHNGVCVHNHVELLGDSNHRALPVYHAHAPKGSLVLQNHGNPVRYRNIWYRELKDYDQP